MKAGWFIVAIMTSIAARAEEPGATTNEADTPSNLDRAEVAEPTEKKPEPALDFGNHASSSTGQFFVYGGNPAQRAALVRMAEDIQQRFHQLLSEKIKNDPDVPIHIILHGKVGDPPRARPIAFELLETPETYLLRMHLDLSRGIDQARLDPGLRSALLYVRALDQTAPGSLQAALQAPWWLVIGLQEADAWQRGKADRELYEGVFQQGAEYAMDDLFALRESDFWKLNGFSRALFRVHSGALVMALLEQKNGRENFRTLCSEIARYQGETPILLRQHFPQLNLSEHSLRKWWALTLAKLSDAPLTEVMNVLETEKILSQALQLRVREENDTIKTLAFGELVERDDINEQTPRERFAMVRPVQDRLNRLSYRCFPSYRPLLLDYQKILQHWAQHGLDKKTRAQLDELAATRQRMHDLALRARDYLDYIEISRANDLSGSFHDFIELKKTLDQTEKIDQPRHDDPISNYLKAFEHAYE